MNNGAPYQNTLREALAERCSKNPAYSLRAFARDLHVPVSRLSEVLNGRRGISASVALKIANRLSLSPEERNLFVLQVEAAHARSRSKKEEAKKALTQAHLNSSSVQLTLDAHRLIADWHHYALLELRSCEDFRPDTNWMAGRLGISTVEVDLALERLERLGLIAKEDDSWIVKEDVTLSPSGIPSDAIKKSHRQILSKADQALSLQSVDDRDFSAITLAIDSRKLLEAKALIKKFRREFAQTLSGTDSPKNRVYNISIQFFALDQNPDSTRSSK